MIGQRKRAPRPPGSAVPILGCSQAVRHQTLTLAFVGPNPATPAMMSGQKRCSHENKRKTEISRDFSVFFDSEVFRNFVDAFRGFSVCGWIRTHETNLYNPLPIFHNSVFGFEPANGYRDFETKCSLHKLFTKSWMQRCFVWIRTHDTHIAAEKSIIRNKCFPRLFGSEPPKNKYCALWHCTNRIGKVEHQCRHRQSKRACYEISSSNRRIRRQPEMAAARRLA